MAILYIDSEGGLINGAGTSYATRRSTTASMSISSGDIIRVMGSQHVKTEISSALSSSTRPLYTSSPSMNPYNFSQFRLNISNVQAFSNTWTVNVSGSHGLSAGDYVQLYSTGSVYLEGLYRIVNVNSTNQFTIDAGFNPNGQWNGGYIIYANHKIVRFADPGANDTRFVQPIAFNAGQSYNSVTTSSNGNIQWLSQGSSAYINTSYGKHTGRTSFYVSINGSGTRGYFNLPSAIPMNGKTALNWCMQFPGGNDYVRLYHTGTNAMNGYGSGQFFWRLWQNQNCSGAYCDFHVQYYRNMYGANYWVPCVANIVNTGNVDVNTFTFQSMQLVVNGYYGTQNIYFSGFYLSEPRTITSLNAPSSDTTGSATSMNYYSVLEPQSSYFVNKPRYRCGGVTKHGDFIIEGNMYRAQTIGGNYGSNSSFYCQGHISSQRMFQPTTNKTPQPENLQTYIIQGIRPSAEGTAAYRPITHDTDYYCVFEGGFDPFSMTMQDHNGPEDYPTYIMAPAAHSNYFNAGLYTYYRYALEINNLGFDGFYWVWYAYGNNYHFSQKAVNCYFNNGYTGIYAGLWNDYGMRPIYYDTYTYINGRPLAIGPAMQLHNCTVQFNYYGIQNNTNYRRHKDIRFYGTNNLLSNQYVGLTYGYGTITDSSSSDLTFISAGRLGMDMYYTDIRFGGTLLIGECFSDASLRLFGCGTSSQDNYINYLFCNIMERPPWATYAQSASSGMDLDTSVLRVYTLQGPIISKQFFFADNSTLYCNVMNLNSYSYGVYDMEAWNNSGRPNAQIKVGTLTFNGSVNPIYAFFGYRRGWISQSTSTYHGSATSSWEMICSSYTGIDHPVVLTLGEIPVVGSGTVTITAWMYFPTDRIAGAIYALPGAAGVRVETASNIVNSAAAGGTNTWVQTTLTINHTETGTIPLEGRMWYQSQYTHTGTSYYGYISDLSVS